MEFTIEESEDNPCESCEFEKKCRWARDYKVVDCKEWVGKGTEDE